MSRISEYVSWYITSAIQAFERTAYKDYGFEGVYLKDKNVLVFRFSVIGLEFVKMDSCVYEQENILIDHIELADNARSDIKLIAEELIDRLVLRIDTMKNQIQA